MMIEPQVKRVVAFIDGQNLFHACREAFGCTFPNYEVAKLAGRRPVVHWFRQVRELTEDAMPRGKKKRITLAEAEKLYPNEWVVFCDVRIDESVTAFIDGVVYWHGPDQQEAYKKSAEIKGPAADFYMGSIPYKKVTLMVGDEVVEKAASGTR